MAARRPLAAPPLLPRPRGLLLDYPLAAPHACLWPVPSKAARGALLQACATPRRPCRAHCAGPSIWDFGRYFLALDGDLKTVQKARP